MRANQGVKHFNPYFAKSEILLEFKSFEEINILSDEFGKFSDIVVNLDTILQETENNILPDKSDSVFSTDYICRIVLKFRYQVFE